MVTLIPIALEIHGCDLTNRVGPGHVCAQCVSCRDMAQSRKPSDTVGELGRVENCASPMPSLRVHDHGDA
jgi:hypothetical protein